MRAIKPVELFLTLGLAASLGACGTSMPNSGGEGGENAATTETMMDHNMDQGGEGGEGGEGSSSGNLDEDYGTTLSLMLGHLMIAKELIAAGEYSQAEPHVGHPVEELYGAIEGQLGDRNVADFKDVLNSAHDLIKTAPESPELETQLDASIQAIDEALAALGNETLQSSDFVLGMMNNLLQVAGEEYAAAIANDQIVETVEYQDSRGFVLHSEMLFEQIADQLSPDAQAEITKAMTELKTAWPTVIPPTTPVKTPQEVLGLIVEIEAASNS
ncbi:MAG: hypothetical protein VKJ86_07850 [Synechococcus sp.]|nr:hypothetical protein [Synechococcus sp.]